MSRAPDSHPRRLNFEAIYTDCFDFVWSLLRRLGIPEAAIDDACQEVFLVVYRRLDEFEHRSSVRTWVFAIARKVAADWRRKNQRHEDHEELSTEEADPSATPFEQACGAESLDVVQRVLDTIPPAKREIFVLSEIFDFSGPEIAACLDLNLECVYTRIRTVREEFDRMARRQARLAEWRPRARGTEPPKTRPSASDRKRVRQLLVPFIPFGADVSRTGAAQAPSLVSGKLAGGLVAAACAGALWLGAGPFGKASASPDRHPSPTPRAELGAAVLSAAAPPAASDHGPTTDDREGEARAGVGAPDGRRDNDNAARREPRTERRKPITENRPPKTGNRRPTTDDREGEARAVIGVPDRRRDSENEARREPTTARATPEPELVPPTDDATVKTDRAESLESRDASAPPALPSIADELRLLRAARTALMSGELDRGSTLLRRYRRRFPAGQLRREAAALRILQLCRADQTSSARRAAHRFSRTFGDAALDEAVARTCPNLSDKKTQNSQ